MEEEQNETELNDPPMISNSLVVDDMRRALFHLQMAYNAAKNDSEDLGKGVAWGIAICIAEVNSQCDALGITKRHL